MTDSSVVLDPAFVEALATVPASAWTSWVGDRTLTDLRDGPPHRTLVASFPLPQSRGHAALCVLETTAGAGIGMLHQAALRRWVGEAPEGAAVLHQQRDADGAVLWTLASAWGDADLRAWLREALSAGASLRSAGWEWLAAPERPAVSRVTTQGSYEIAGRRHDVMLFEPGAVASVYRRLTRGAQPEVDLLRHLERVPGVRVAPRLLGSAHLRSPNGQRTGSAVLEEIVEEAATARSVIVNRLRRALEGDPSLQAAALDDARAAGAITHELHAALGRPFEQGVVVGAVPATHADIETWIARAWTTLGAATTAARASAEVEPGLLAALELLPGKLQQFGAAAELSPGLMHRIHGNLSLDTILMVPPRIMSIVEFDGDSALPDAERTMPQSPWRDVARVLLSLAQAAADAATLAGDDTAFEIAWLWEREARKACLEGYGPGTGALHALVALFELEFAAQLLIDGLQSRPAATAVASHTLQRLTRTIV